MRQMFLVKIYLGIILNTQVNVLHCRFQDLLMDVLRVEVQLLTICIVYKIVQRKRTRPGFITMVRRVIRLRCLNQRHRRIGQVLNNVPTNIVIITVVNWFVIIMLSRQCYPSLCIHSPKQPLVTLKPLAMILPSVMNVLRGVIRINMVNRRVKHAHKEPIIKIKGVNDNAKTLVTVLQVHLYR